MMGGRDIRLSILLAALAIGLLAASVMIGSTAIAPSSMLPAIFYSGDPAIRAIIWEVRLPRGIAAALTGAALGGSGAALQAILRNPLAEPGVLGVSAAAACCATGIVYFGLAGLTIWLMPLGSLAGALGATGLLVMAAMRSRGVATLILFGVALSALSGAVMGLFVNLAPNPFSLSDLINWTAGSVANRSWLDIGIALPFIAAGLTLLLLTRRSLSVFVLGEETAYGLGVDLARVRLIAIVGTGLATGGAVALAGMVGFIGLVAPHAVRPFVGHDAGATVLPASLSGACLLVIADLAIRLMPWGSELHLGTLAALIGTPLFIWLVFRLGSLRHG